jgi:hypothetical protein
MGVSNQGRNERGVALLLSLIILLVLTMLGVSAFHNSHIQERSAGNMRLQSVAFEAAAAGASNSINFFDANRELGPDQLCGSLGHEGWDAPTAWVSANAVGEATLKQRMYCLADEYPTVEDEDDTCEEDDVECRPARSQLFVLSRGEVFSGGNLVAQRDVEIRLDIGGGGGVGEGCGALCFPSCNPGTFDFGNSNAFQVDGNGGPAITGACPDMTTAIRNGIRDNRIGNYIGGVDTTSPDAPWDDPDTVEDFRSTVEAKAMADNGSGTCMTYCYNASTAYHFGNPAFGTPADPQVTYIAGNAYFGGNVTGAGIMFVNGNLHWNGTPKFEGLIVTLGGTFTVSGGGLGGDHAGSVVILNASGNGTFGNSNLYNTGGGTALYRFDCGALWAAWETLDADGQALWSPNCEVGPASPYGAGPGELIVASWRENIGWREHFFGSD